MTNSLIKVAFLVSYDWHLLKIALPLVYQHSDTIYLALDKQRLTWSGNSFEFDDEDFQNWIAFVDQNKKIVLYEDNFYISTLSPMECEVRERHMTSKKMGEGGWHLQLDSDEYFINFGQFTKYLNQLNINQKPVNINVSWINLFKKTSKGYLFISNKKDLFLIQVATNKPQYLHGRRNSHFNHISPFFIVHDSWARSDTEMWQKISNWGHKNDFDIENYFYFWKNINETNFKGILDFHPIEPKTWEYLELITASSALDVVVTLQNRKFPMSRFQRFIMNNRNIARVKHLWSKIFT